MSVRSDKDIKKSAAIGISWTTFILGFGVLSGAVGRLFLGNLEDTSLVFILMVKKICPPLISGILLSAILAAAMSSADSQLLASASAFSSDIYKPVFRKNASDKEMLWAGRMIVLIISATAVLIASNPNSGSVMDLVGNAWGLFGAAFGPTVMLSLFWKRFNQAGAVAGIVAGSVADIIWLIRETISLSPTGIYEIIPATLIGIVAAVAATLLSKTPGNDVAELYEKALNLND